MLTSVVVFLMDWTKKTFSISPVADDFLPEWSSLLSTSKEANTVK